jgi:DNA-directed RNA polymerase specialized sigma24 family protein
MDSEIHKKQREGLTEEAFTGLLAWLDSDRERAGQKYEMIRVRLIKIFSCRGSSMPEELADATVDRVAAKVKEIAEAYVGDPASYFYGVAQKIYLEHGRRAGLQDPLPRDLAANEAATEPAIWEDGMQECFDRCIDSLSSRNRELILSYYAFEHRGKDKLERRKALADRLSIGPNALWIRAHRIRESLKKCVEQCLQGQVAVHPEGNV